MKFENMNLYHFGALFALSTAFLWSMSAILFTSAGEKSHSSASLNAKIFLIHGRSANAGNAIMNVYAKNGA